MKRQALAMAMHGKSLQGQIQRLNDQTLIMTAILEVRRQLEACNPKEWDKQGEILVRLVTLYSLLDLKRIRVVIEDADSRKFGRVA